MACVKTLIFAFAALLAVALAAETDKKRDERTIPYSGFGYAGYPYAATGLGYHGLGYSGYPYARSGYPMIGGAYNHPYSYGAYPYAGYNNFGAYPYAQYVH